MEGDLGRGGIVLGLVVSENVLAVTIVCREILSVLYYDIA
jgi:hypothetical protein